MCTCIHEPVQEAAEISIAAMIMEQRDAAMSRILKVAEVLSQVEFRSGRIPRSHRRFRGKAHQNARPERKVSSTKFVLPPSTTSLPYLFLCPRKLSPSFFIAKSQTPEGLAGSSVTFKAFQGQRLLQRIRSECRSGLEDTAQGGGSWGYAGVNSFVSLQVPSSSNCFVDDFRTNTAFIGRHRSRQGARTAEVHRFTDAIYRM